MDDALNDYKDLNSVPITEKDYEKVINILSKPFENRIEQENNLVISTMSKIGFFKENFSQAKDFNSLLLECSKILTKEIFQKGDIIYNMGDVSDKLYVLLTGRVGILIPKEMSQINREIEELKSKIASHRPSISISQHGSINENPINNLKHDMRSKMNKRMNIMPKNQILIVPNINLNKRHSDHNIARGKIDFSRPPTAMDNLFLNPESIDNKGKGLLSNTLDSHSAIFPNNDLFSNEEEYVRLIALNDNARNKYFRDRVCLFKLLRLLSNGSYFGERGVMFDKPRKYSALVLEDSIMVSIDKDHINNIFNVHLNRTNAKISYLMQLLNISSQSLATQLIPYFIDNFYVMKDKIYDEGDESNAVFFLAEGEVKITKKIYQEALKTTSNDINDEAQSPIKAVEEEIFNSYKIKKSHLINQEITILSPGAFFGDEILFNIPQRRFTSTVITSDALVYKLIAKDFKSLLKIKSDILDILRSKAGIANTWFGQRIQAINDSSIKAKSTFNGLLARVHEKKSNKPKIAIKIQGLSKTKLKFQNSWTPSAYTLSKMKSADNIDFKELEFHEKVIITNKEHIQNKPKFVRKYASRIGLFNDPKLDFQAKNRLSLINNDSFHQSSNLLQSNSVTRIDSKSTAHIATTKKINDSYYIKSSTSINGIYGQSRRTSKTNISIMTDRKIKKFKFFQNNSHSTGPNYNESMLRLDNLLTMRKFSSGEKNLQRPSTAKSIISSNNVPNYSRSKSHLIIDDPFHTESESIAYRRYISSPYATPKKIIYQGISNPNIRECVNINPNSNSNPNFISNPFVNTKNEHHPHSRDSLDIKYRHSSEELFKPTHLFNELDKPNNNIDNGSKEDDLDCDLVVTHLDLPKEQIYNIIQNNISIRPFKSRTLISSKHNQFRNKPTRPGLISRCYKTKTQDNIAKLRIHSQQG